MKQFYRGANLVIVTTMDGVEHVYQFTKNLIVHGGKKPGVDALEGLRDGAIVVIHYTGNGAQAAAEEIDVLGEEGLKITEGVVTDIERRSPHRRLLRRRIGAQDRPLLQEGLLTQRRPDYFRVLRGRPYTAFLSRGMISLSLPLGTRSPRGRTAPSVNRTYVPCSF